MALLLKLVGIAAGVAASAYVRNIFVVITVFGMAVITFLLIMRYAGSETLAKRAGEDLRVIFGRRDKGG